MKLHNFNFKNHRKTGTLPATSSGWEWILVPKILIAFSGFYGGKKVQDNEEEEEEKRLEKKRGFECEEGRQLELGIYNIRGRIEIWVYKNALEYLIGCLGQSDLAAY